MGAFVVMLTIYGFVLCLRRAVVAAAYDAYDAYDAPSYNEAISRARTRINQYNRESASFCVIASLIKTMT